MNAHAEYEMPPNRAIQQRMLCGRDIHIPKGVYCLLVSDRVEILQDFKKPKQALINAFYNMSANFWFATAKLLHFFELRKKIAKFLQIIVKIVRLNVVR